MRSGTSQWSWLRAGSILLLPLATVLAVETVSRLSLVDAWRWMTLSESVNTLRFTYLWLLFCLLLVFALVNRLRWAAGICMSLALAMAVLNAGKQRILDQPLLLSDFALVGTVSRIWSRAYFPFTWTQVGWFVLLVAVSVVVCRAVLPRWRLGLRPRLALALAAGVALLFFTAWAEELAARTVPIERKLTVTWRPDSNNVSSRRVVSDVQNPDYSVSFNYQSFGMLPGMLLSVSRKAAKTDSAPPVYTQREVERAWAAFAPTREASLPDNAERPHVVVVLAESFWDPNWLEGVTIAPDPLATFHELATRTNACSFISVSPIFGGYTCKAEFELLSGLPISLLPESMVPHVKTFRGQVPSLPSAFKQAGYETVAVHPFLPDFWNRNLIYPLIGFDRFIHIGNITHRQVKGKFIGDDAVADEILDLIRASNEPTFVFAVTMQNHSPYGDGRYGEVERDSVAVAPESGLSPEAVRDYVHGIRDADAMLGKLTRGLETSPRRVVLLFLGDHQPNLIPIDMPQQNGSSHRVRAGVGHPALAIRNRFEGDALLWTSRGVLRAPPRTPLSIAALPSRVLREAGVPLPPTLELSERVFARYPVLQRKWYMSADGGTSILTHPIADSLLAAAQLISYDLLPGRHYTLAVLRRAASESSATEEAR